MNGDRYVVTELAGYLTAREPGVSVHVVDTANARRVVATYRSEDVKRGTRAERIEAVRRRGRGHAYVLNHPPSRTLERP